MERSSKQENDGVTVKGEDEERSEGGSLLGNTCLFLCSTQALSSRKTIQKHTLYAHSSALRYPGRS